YTIPPGHHLRLALSNTYWPHAWPSLEPTTLTLHSGELRLPTLSAPLPPAPSLPTHWSQPEHAQTVAMKTIRPESRARTIHHDILTGTHTLRDEDDTGLVEYLPIGIQRSHRTINTHSLTDGNPLSAKTECQHELFIGRGDWQIRILTDSALTSDAEYFHLTNVLEAYEGKVRVFTKTHSLRVKRDMV
ncbi:MAG TPA: CocE/NonD family hydrolase C-terminal non-catalytic domain-containing protein, partial [Anaerolineales bacterium]|nr:CocE/NonD family hydrolase C-terminal non-catalytic domain-containing protein [Anaerolineales bacterium]